MNETEMNEVSNQVVRQKRPKKSEQMQIHTNPGDNTKYIEHSLRIAQLPKIEIVCAETVWDRLMKYFTICAESDMKPSVAGMALACGVDKSTIWRWANENSDQDLRTTVKKAYTILDAQMNDYMQNGHINPVSGIFLMKNNFGYADKQEVVVTPKAPLGDATDQKALEQAYVESVPEE